MRLFVYGTLLPGGRNHHLLGKAGSTATAGTAHGLALYRNIADTFPYASPAAGRSVAGILITIPDHDWTPLRDRLDLLEGYNPHRPDLGHYVRRRWLIHTTPDQAIDAWTYLAGPTVHLSTDQLIPAAAGEPTPTAEQPQPRHCVVPHVPPGRTGTWAVTDHPDAVSPTGTSTTPPPPTRHPLRSPR